MTTKEIKIYRDLMGANEVWAAKTRVLLAQKRVLMINLIGSPGAGKTSLLEGMGVQLDKKMKFAVLEGDVETTRDAERIREIGVPVSQLLSGGACHLEAKLVHYALQDLDLEHLDLVVVENVGNMVCPAEFDIGEHAKIAVLSVAEGDDKPLKYPLLFQQAKAAVLSKMDLLPYVPFDLPACRKYIQQVNAKLPVFEVSALQQEGLGGFMRWLCELKS
ncbi:MAG: hydrogenase nickel incorporation protein HypB [Planctomycetes bacterium]|nr:hydrogenase nickel incorporation protein HypB [Planctomycetota bacterium]